MRLAQHVLSLGGWDGFHKPFHPPQEIQCQLGYCGDGDSMVLTILVIVAPSHYLTGLELTKIARFEKPWNRYKIFNGLHYSLVVHLVQHSQRSLFHIRSVTVSGSMVGGCQAFLVCYRLPTCLSSVKNATQRARWTSPKQYGVSNSYSKKAETLPLEFT